MNVLGLVTLALTVAVGAWLTWPKASEARDERDRMRRWLAEGGFDGPWALAIFQGARVALAGALVVASLALAPSNPLILLVASGIAVVVGLAAPVAWVESRRSSA